MIHNMTEGEWVTLSEEDLEELARPDYSYLEEYDAMALWSEVLPGLWQGGTDGREDFHYGVSPGASSLITKKDFDTVVTLYGRAMPVDWHVKELRFGVYDSVMDDFDPRDLFELVKTAHTDWKNGKRVLIRCQAGWNRSGLITALVLMREGYTAKSAVKLIREKRSRSALCNRHFEDFLYQEDPRVWRGNTYGYTPKKKRVKN